MFQAASVSSPNGGRACFAEHAENRRYNARNEPAQSLVAAANIGRQIAYSQLERRPGARRFLGSSLSIDDALGIAEATGAKRAADGVEQDAGAGLAAMARDLKQAVAAIQALRDRWRRRRRSAKAFHPDRPCLRLGAVGIAYNPCIPRDDYRFGSKNVTI
jgi:hypothetical protein